MVQLSDQSDDSTSNIHSGLTAFFATLSRRVFLGLAMTQHIAMLSTERDWLIAVTCLQSANRVL